MSRIQLNSSDMTRLLTKTEDAEGEYGAGIEALPSFPDGGIASEQISLIVRLAVEGCSLFANATAGVCEVARAAVEDLTLTEEEVRESLDSISQEAFDQ